ncbi:MAG: hypothetical protein HFH03_12210 [Dorea sp.]|nr:hypothetical protein [Dorea sp.]
MGNNYICDTDDSLTLIGYPADKQTDIISLKETFSGTGLDKPEGGRYVRDSQDLG